MSYLGSSAAPMVQAFSAPFAEQFNGGVSSITLSRSVSKTTDITVVVNNIPQSPFDGSYSVNNKTLTLAETVSAGVGNIYVRYNDAPVASITPIDGSVSYPKLSPDLQAATYAFKNRIINGAMMIDQRNSGASVSMASGDGGYCLDRWRTQKNGAGTLTIQQSTTAPTGFSSSLKVTVTGTSTPSAGDYYTIGQIIEGNNFYDMAWGTASNQPIAISFWVQSSVTGTYTASVYNWALGSYAYPATFTINSANTWEQKTITISGATSAASGTWATGNTGSLYLRVDLGSGSSFNGTANAWNSSGGFRTSSSVSLISNASATFYITGVQLEKGSTATSFDYRPYGTELALCQRYYVNFPWKSNTNKVASGIVVSSTISAYSFGLSCPMRVDPTGAYSSGAQAYDAGTTAAFTSIDAIAAYGSTISAQFTSSGGGLTVGRAALIRLNASGDYVSFSAEL